MAQKRIDRKKDYEKGTVTFTVLESGEQLVCEVGKVFPGYADFPTVARHLAIHAVNAKVGDSAADPKEQALVAMTTTWDQLLAGEWTARGEGSGSGTRVTIVDRAVAAHKGISVEEAIAAINEAAVKKGVEPKDIRKGLSKNEHIAAEVAKIRAEQMKVKAKAAKDAVKNVDVEELDI